MVMLRQSEVKARLEVLAICIGLSVAYLGPNLQPIWVDTFIKDGLLTAKQTGWLASSELLLTAGAAIALPIRAGEYSRRVSVSAALVVALGNVLAMVPVLGVLAAGRLLSGIGMGFLLAAVTRIAVERPDSQRVLSLGVGAALLLSAIIFYLTPQFAGELGLIKLYAVAVGSAVLSATIAAVGFADGGSASNGALERPRFATLPLIGCLGLASATVGVNCAATYTVTIGGALGFDLHTIGTALGLGTLLTIVGPAASHALGERLGLLTPIYLGLLLLGVSIFLLVTHGSPFLFGFSIACLSASIAFCMPFAITLIGRVDPSGRFASAAGGFAMLGTAAGPALGSTYAGAGRLHALASMSTSFVVVGMILFFLVGRGLRARGVVGLVS
jgi:hypothetical protein